MKYFNTFLFIFATVFVLMSCSSNTNDPDFLENISGRYLYSADETVLVYSKDNMLFLNWRGAKDIKPSKLNEDTFYVKEMNAKIQFRKNPEDQKEYLIFLPKNKEDKIDYIHKKMSASEKIPSQYLADGNYEKALEGYLAIRTKDSLSPILNRRRFRNKGYQYLGKDSVKLAIDVFKINVVLHPSKSNPYDNLAEAYLRSKDTAKALTNYQKALEFDSGNRRLQRTIEKLQEKEVENTN